MNNYRTHPCSYPTSNMRIIHQEQCLREIYKWECHIDDPLFGYPCTCYKKGGLINRGYAYYNAGCVINTYGGGTDE